MNYRNSSAGLAKNLLFIKRFQLLANVVMSCAKIVSLNFHFKKRVLLVVVENVTKNSIERKIWLIWLRADHLFPLILKLKRKSTNLVFRVD